MSYDYSGMVATATSLIARFGASFDYTHTEKGAFNDDTGKYEDVLSYYSANAVKSTFSSFDRANLDILSSDLKLIAEVADYSIGDTLTVNGDTYKIKDFTKLVEPANTKIIYILQVSK